MALKYFHVRAKKTKSQRKYNRWEDSICKKNLKRIKYSGINLTRNVLEIYFKILKALICYQRTHGITLANTFKCFTQALL